MIDENNKNDLVRDMETLGLKDKEARVYISLLGLGEAGSSKIIKSSGLHGQFVYAALEKLEEKGLVQHFIKRGRKKFVAKSPKTLVSLIDQQKSLALRIAEKLQEIIVLPPEQQFETFQGKESYIAHEFELLEKAPEGSELLIIGGTGDEFLKTMEQDLNRYEARRNEKKIAIRYLGSMGQKEDLRKAVGSRERFDYRFLPGLFTGMVNTNIWPDAINFNIFGTPVTAFVISNPQIAGSYRQFFETLWKMGTR